MLVATELLLLLLLAIAGLFALARWLLSGRQRRKTASKPQKPPQSRDDRKN